MKTLCAIVVVDQNWGIGMGGDQLIYLPSDLKRFQSLTTGHGVVLGRKTLSTFPHAKPLPRRTNYILSSDPSFEVEGGVVCRSVDEFLERASEDTVFVIGGGTVYEQLLPLCSKVYVTKIAHSYQADCFFPNLDDHPDWVEISEEISPPIEEKGVSYSYITYYRP
ncbi:MAG: dihydrofolate reductase [Eubacteriales bacterium]